MHSPFKISFAFITTAVLGLMISAASIAADTTMKEKAKEAGNDMSRGAKKMGRDVSDKTCEMINGKMECAAKKVKHGVQNTADKVEDAVD